MGRAVPCRFEPCHDGTGRDVDVLRWKGREGRREGTGGMKGACCSDRLPAANVIITILHSAVPGVSSAPTSTPGDTAPDNAVTGGHRQKRWNRYDANDTLTSSRRPGTTQERMVLYSALTIRGVGIG